MALYPTAPVGWVEERNPTKKSGIICDRYEVPRGNGYAQLGRAIGTQPNLRENGYAQLALWQGSGGLGFVPQPNLQLGWVEAGEAIYKTLYCLIKVNEIPSFGSISTGKLEGMAKTEETSLCPDKPNPNATLTCRFAVNCRQNIIT